MRRIRNKRLVHYALKTPNKDCKREQPEVKKVWKEFNTTTSAHGIPALYKSKGFVKKLVWSVALMVCMVGFSYHIIMLVLKYLRFDVDTKLVLHQNHSLPFPAVTICNTNSVRSSELYKNPRLNALFEEWDLDTETSASRSRRESPEERPDPQQKQDASKLMSSQSRPRRSVQIGDEFWIFKDHNCAGNRITWFASMPVKDCLFKCAERQECVGIVYGVLNQKCFLKSQCNTMTTSSGFNTYVRKYEYEAVEDTGCNNNLIERATLTTLDECLSYCDGLPSCVGIVLGSTCNFKHTCGHENYANAPGKTTYIKKYPLAIVHTVFRLGTPPENPPVLYDLWISDSFYPPSLETPLTPDYFSVNNEGTPRIYKSPIVDSSWNAVTQIQVECYRDGVSGMFNLFSNTDMDKNSWFSVDHLTSSSYTDLHDAVSMSMIGNDDLNRRFLNRVSGKCNTGNDMGWSVLLDTNTMDSGACPWDDLETRPVWLYSSDTQRSYRKDFTVAETVFIKVKLDTSYFGGVCVSSCVEMPDGDYISCLSSDIQVTCISGVLCYNFQGSDQSNREYPCSELTTTQAPTTMPASTQAPTPVPESTQAPKTVPESTQAPTPVPESTQAPEAVPESTHAPKIVPESTQAPKTVPESTQAPKTVPETTQAPTTVLESTQAPTTVPESTPAPKTVPESTPAPTPSQDSVSYISDRPLREDFKRQEDILRIMSEIDVDTKKAMGSPKQKTVFSCTFGDTICGEEDFAWFYDNVYGNCYVFNAQWNQQHNKSFNSLKPGRRHGLSLVVDIGKEDFIPIIGESAGVIVVVTNPEDIAFPEDEGVFALPERSTAIGLKYFENKRKGNPYTECTKSEDLEGIQNIYEELYSVSYSMQGCFKTCYQSHAIKSCGCGDAQYPISGLMFGNNSIACDVRNVTQDNCKYRILQQYIKDELECNCPTPCNDKGYSYSVTTMLWPSDVSKASVLQQLESKLNIFDGSLTDLSNLVKVEVYYEDLDYREIIETAAYTANQLLADVGGVLGLWLGLSFFTLMEFSELSVDIVILVIHKCASKSCSDTKIQGSNETNRLKLCTKDIDKPQKHRHIVHIDYADYNFPPVVIGPPQGEVVEKQTTMETVVPVLRKQKKVVKHFRRHKKVKPLPPIEKDCRCLNSYKRMGHKNNTTTSVASDTAHNAYRAERMDTAVHEFNFV